MTDFDCDCIVYDGREPWLEGRRQWFGSSDTAGIFGVGYADQSPVTVVASKFHPCEVDVETKRMQIGLLIEPALRSIFRHETGLECNAPGQFTAYRSKTHPFLGATLDGWTMHPDFGKTPVELKNVSNFNAAEWKNGDEPPLKYSVQVQHQLAVTGASHGFLLGLIGGNEPIVKIIPRNDRFIEGVLMGKLAEFWGYVERRELPPVDESYATARLLSMLWPQDSGNTVRLPDEADEWDQQLEAAKKDIADAEFRKVAAENKIKAAIGEASAGDLLSGVRYTWRTQERKEYVCKATSFRVLRRAK